MNKKIAIIGGGIGGLATGYFLAKKGAEVTILEKEKEIGGLMADFKIDGKSLEKFYHHIFKTDTEIIDLIKEMGLINQLKWHKSLVSLYHRGKFYPFNGSIDLLKFKGLGFLSKIRLGLVYVWLKLDKRWKKYQKITAIEWMKKWAGKQAYQIIWEPLIIGKFHHFADKVSMAWLWARIHTRGGSKNNKGEEVLGYLDGGFGQIMDKLAKNIEKLGGKIILDTKVDEIKIKKIEKEFDLIIDTRPIKEINYLGVIALVFSSKQNLSKDYWHNINDLDSPFVAFIQHTNLVDKSNYNNKDVYYLGTYLPQNHKYFKIADKDIEIEFFNYLKKIKPEFDKNKVIEVKVFKNIYAQQVVIKNYKVPAQKISDKLYRLNFSQIYPQDRGINFGVKEAKKLVKKIERLVKSF